MSTLPVPQIDQNRCNGCGLCLDTCPTQALGQRDGKAYLLDPAACTYCTACEEICPESAIALPFLIVLAADQALVRRPSHAW
jgi:ferredoxin